jgi:hypothetical protein
MPANGRWDLIRHLNGYSPRYKKTCNSVLTFNPSFTHWVQNVPRRGIFFNNSRWYRVTKLPFFLFVHLSPTDKIITIRYICYLLRIVGVFFKSNWTILYPWKVIYLSNSLRTAKQTVSVTSAQNGCAMTTLSRQFE